MKCRDWVGVFGSDGLVEVGSDWVGSGVQGRGWQGRGRVGRGK